MKFTNHPSILSLPALQVRCWQARPDGLHLRVLSGRLWLTQSGDVRDHFLESGDEIVLTPQRVVIEAQSDARYVLQGAQPGLARHALALSDWLRCWLHRAPGAGRSVGKQPDAM